MNIDAIPRGRNAWIPLFALIVSLLLAACASPPPAPVAVVLTQYERTIAALKAMNFEPADDGWR